MKSLVLAALLIVMAAGAQAEGHAHRGPTVLDAWSRPASAGATGAGFLTVRTDGAAEVLVGADSPAAARVEIHRSSMKGGVMSMAKVDRLAIPAHGAVRFEPGGLHLMLLELKVALKPGDRVPLTLRFASGARTKTELVVREPGESMHMAH